MQAPPEIKRKKMNVFLIRLLFSTVALYLSLNIVAAMKNRDVEETAFQPQKPVAEWTEDSQLVTFFLQDYSLLPHVKVIVNNEVRGSFDNRYLSVAVQNGDRIYIDATFYDSPVRIEVLDVSRGVKIPARGDVFNLQGNTSPTVEVVADGSEN